MEKQLTRISRHFTELSDEVVNSFDHSSLFSETGWRRAIDWIKLLESKRILIVSEAGAGKTHECRAEQQRLWETGQPAFYLDLSQLSNSNICDLLLPEEEVRFEAWRISQSDTATFFLDSIDELKLTLGSFEVALKRLSKAISGQLGRVTIVVTTRPIPIDFSLIEKYLPIPEVTRAFPLPNGKSFADIVMNGRRSQNISMQGEDVSTGWRRVALMPLSDDEIRQMAVLEGIDDAESLLADIIERNAEDFARRPQDLIEICADWKEQRRIRTHSEQVGHNVNIKLKPREDRNELAQISEDKAVDGARRLALASLLTRKLTIRFSAEADSGGELGTAIDPASILTDWTAKERRALLERPLFGFASYGRVRFHHRSVIEFLAAQRLEDLLAHGMSIKAIKRLLFAETAQGLRIVKPTMRPVAAWLASRCPSIFNEIRDREPNILLEFADPAILSIQQRTEALRAYVGRFGKGNWRGLNVPRMQVHRFFSGDLAPLVLELWQSDIENQEVREFLLEMIASVPMHDGVNVARSVVTDPTADTFERLEALNALIAMDDPQIDTITQSMETEPDSWPDRLVTSCIIRLFPSKISTERLSNILARITESRSSVGDINWALPRSIATANFPSGYLETLREKLTALVLRGVEWKKNWPHLTTPRAHLLAPLAAVCLRQIKEGSPTGSVIRSCVIAVRLLDDDHSRDEPAAELRTLVSNFAAPLRSEFFWADDSFYQEYHPQSDPSKRMFEAAYHGMVKLNPSQDAGWVVTDLSDPNRPLSERAVMLEAAIRDVWDRQTDQQSYLIGLKQFVQDCPTLIGRIEECLRPVSVDPEYARMENEHLSRKKKEERRKEKDHASWVEFWTTVVASPETAFSSNGAENIVWNLWSAMDRTGDQSRSSGWNRRFIEDHFGHEVADQLRLAMMRVWRQDKPTLRSERSTSEKGTYLVRWQLGLAAIAAESEDENWASKLTIPEAELAVRYVPIELNGFPSWIESLAATHAVAIQSVLSPELQDELDFIVSDQSNLGLLQDISYVTSSVAILFLPQLRVWLEQNSGRCRLGESESGASARLRRIIDILLKNGDFETIEYIKTTAEKLLSSEISPTFVKVWLPVLFKLEPSSGMTILERILSDVDIEQEGFGTYWISLLFGDRHNSLVVDLRKPEFTVSLLLKLLRLAYRHVRLADDISHDGVFSPGIRDNAQDGRNALLSAFLDIKGPEAWAAKLEMANDSLFIHFRDRAILLANEKAANEADGLPMTEDSVSALYKGGEPSPITREDMFSLLLDRLDDLDDLLLQDDSPRAAWAGISDEKVIRREIARHLRIAAKGAYSVDQESVTADEKETDIRLRATSGQQAVIELKVGDKDRSGKELRDTIGSQFVKKYMAQEACRAGCLMITLSKSRTWQHPDTGINLDALGLREMLQNEADRIIKDMAFEICLIVKVFDFQPRLLPEKLVREKGVGKKKRIS